MKQHCILWTLTLLVSGVGWLLVSTSAAQNEPIKEETVGGAEAVSEQTPEGGTSTEHKPQTGDDNGDIDEKKPDGNKKPEPTQMSELRIKIKEAVALADGLASRVLVIRGKNTITSKDADRRKELIESQKMQLAALDEIAQDLQQRRKLPEEKQGDIKGDEEKLLNHVKLVEKALAAIRGQLTDLEAAKGWDLVDTLLAARCATAICFANGNAKYWLGIEPLVELPIGISSAIGNTSLAEYINNHEIRVDLAAGLRVWFFEDVVSLSIYFSKPLIESNVRPEGTAFAYPGYGVRRPFPGFAIGLLFDSLWIGFDRNELRNGDGTDPSAFNPDFPPNTVVSSAWSITIALQPVTSFRTAIGTANKASEEK